MKPDPGSSSSSSEAADNDAVARAPLFSPQLVALGAPLSPAAEAIGALRNHILTQHVQEGRRGLAICGPSLGVGCTFVAANLAVALSQVGIKTLLVDGDLRRPAIDELITPPEVLPGLGACLASAHEHVSKFISSDVLPNLSILYSGGASSIAQELLARDRFTEVMNYCLRDFDMTIVDTPPANSCSDARRVSNVVGYALIVARRNASLVNDVRTLSRQLADDHAKVIGTIMNVD